MAKDLPQLRRTPTDPWLTQRMHHSAALGQLELALTDAFSAAISAALTAMRDLVLPTLGARPTIPDPATATSTFMAACAEFVPDVAGEAWWAEHGQEFVGGVLPLITKNLTDVLTQAAADPSISVEQERAAALSVLHLGGGPAATITAAVDPDKAPTWGEQWAKAWRAWDAVARLDDDAAVARGHRRVAEALQAKLKKADAATRKRLEASIEIRLNAALKVNPAASKVTAALKTFNKLTATLGKISGNPPFPGKPVQPLSKAVQGQKNYYAQSERIARSATVSSYNMDALDRAKADQSGSGVPLVKTWLATIDQRTRESHAEADGQQVGLHESFIVGGEELDYPGDPAGSDEETANCRCTFITEEADSTGDAGNLSALTAATEAPVMTEPAPVPIGWKGVLAPLDTLSGDGRTIATPAALRLRTAPIPFSWQRVSDDGHNSSVLVGRVDKAYIQDGLLMGEGTFDLENDDAVEAARQLGAGFASRVSVDLDDVTVEVQMDETVSGDPDDLFFMPEMSEIMTDWRLAGATLVTISAFDEAIITPVFAGAATDVVAPPADPAADVPALPADDTAAASLQSFALDGEIAVGDTVTVPDPDNADATVQGTVATIDVEGEDGVTQVTVSVEADDGGDPYLVTVPIDQVTKVSDAPAEDAPPADDAPPAAAALVASVAPLTPPREWFNNPAYGIGGDDKRLVSLMGQPGSYAAPLTIDDDGRVSGHLAAWGTCHTGLAGCTTPPSSRSNYAGFMLGETLTDQGRIATGVLTYDTGHALIELDARAAVKHYDDTGTAFAQVVVGEDIHGIWVAGALLPDVPAEKLPRIRGAKLSGDWRGGELRAALAVNTPGFGVMRARANDLDSAPLALVASGMVVAAPVAAQAFTPELISALATELERRRDRREKADRIGSKVNRFKVQRMAARLNKE